jgi:hypothetical protein
VSDLPPREQIEVIVSKLKTKGVPAAPVVESLALATSHPEAVYDLAISVMKRFPKGGTFLDAALSYLPETLWPRLVESALEALTESKGNEAAESVIAYASLQSPTSLHPHLTRIFSLQPNAGSYYESYPWRESGKQHFTYLRNVVDNSASKEDRLRAWEAMLQTRNVNVLTFAISQAKTVYSRRHSLSREDWLQAYLHLVGFNQEDGSLKRTCSDALYHLQFPDDYFEGQSRPPWLERVHPTWRFSIFSLGSSCSLWRKHRE